MRHGEHAEHLPSLLKNSLMLSSASSGVTNTFAHTYIIYFRDNFFSKKINIVIIKYTKKNY